jgi:hypothetical protein
VRRIALLSLSLILVLALAPAAAAANRGGPGREPRHGPLAQGDVSSDALVVLNGRAFVGPDDRVDAVVVFHGSAVVQGTVDGPVVAFDAGVVISGVVDGDVTVFRGHLVVAPGATVTGDVFARDPEVAPGTVQGEVRDAPSARFRIGWLAGFLVWLAFAVSVLALGYLILWLAPRGADATYRAATEAFPPAIGWGFAAFVGIPIVAVLLFVTLVGIPLGLVMLFALLPVYTIGYAMTAWVVGRLLIRPPRGRGLAMLVGWAIVAGLSIIPVAGGIVWFAATLFGLGAIVVAMWRARRGWASAPVGPGALGGLPEGAATESLVTGGAPSIPPPPVSTTGP